MHFIKKIIRTLFRLTFNFFHKLRDSFDPRLYSKRHRVSGIINGKSSHHSSSVAIFVLYQKQNIPFYARNVLRILNSLHVDVVVTVNNDIGQAQIDWLINNCYLLILRENFGRDFGAYKDAINILDLDQYQKLLLVNDSLTYFSKNLDHLFKYFINSSKNLITLTENFDKEWHAQTHFLSLSKEIFLCENFKRFWNEYKPFNSRPHSIFNGEIKFSKDVLSAYMHDRDVYYGVDKIINVFSAGDIFLEDEEESALLSLLPDIDEDRNVLIQFMKWRLRYGDNSDLKIISNLEYIAVKSVLALVEKKNSSHSLAFIGPFITKTCVIKRDLVFRESFSLTQIGVVLKKLGLDTSEIQQTIYELTAKGSVSRINLYKRLKASLGLL